MSTTASPKTVLPLQIIHPSYVFDISLTGATLYLNLNVIDAQTFLAAQISHILMYILLTGSPAFSITKKDRSSVYENWLTKLFAYYSFRVRILLAGPILTGSQVLL